MLEYMLEYKILDKANFVVASKSYILHFKFISYCKRVKTFNRM